MNHKEDEAEQIFDGSVFKQAHEMNEIVHQAITTDSKSSIGNLETRPDRNDAILSSRNPEMHLPNTPAGMLGFCKHTRMP